VITRYPLISLTPCLFRQITENSKEIREKFDKRV
jgi:hypothetical protein